MVSALARRKQVAYAKARGLSERRACALMSVARSALHYESKLGGRDAPVLAAMSILSAQYRRYGYRRIQIFLERQGHPMSADRAWRLWPLAGLQVPRRRPRRRVSVHRPRPQPATAARLGLRLRVRRMRQWPTVKVPDCDRRIHARMSGHRCRRIDPLRTGC